MLQAHAYSNKSEQSSSHHVRFMWMSMLRQSDRSGRHRRDERFLYSSFTIKQTCYRATFLPSFFFHLFIHSFLSFIHSFILFIHSFVCLTGSWIYGCVIVVLISKGEDIRTKGTHRRRSEEYPLYSTTTTTHKDNSCGSKKKKGEREKNVKKKKKRERDRVTAISINRI